MCAKSKFHRLKVNFRSVQPDTAASPSSPAPLCPQPWMERNVCPWNCIVFAAVWGLYSVTTVNPSVFLPYPRHCTRLCKQAATTADCRHWKTVFHFFPFPLSLASNTFALNSLRKFISQLTGAKPEAGPWWPEVKKTLITDTEQPLLLVWF